MAQLGSFSVSSGFSATQTITDNRNLSAIDRQADAVTILTPSVRINSRAGRVQGSLDYALSGLYFARSPSRFQLQNALNALVSAEVIPGYAFIDARASISQQSISALDLQGARPSSINPNSTEVRTFSLSPRFQGGRGRGLSYEIGGFRFDADFETSLSSSGSISSGGNGGNGGNGGSTDSRTAFSYNGGLRVSTSLARDLSGAVELNRNVSDFNGGRKTTQDVLRATLNYRPQSDLRLFVSAGKERNDVQTNDQRVSDTWGGGADWQPTARTRLSAKYEHRYFGTSHTVSLSHRLRRSIISFTDSRSSTESTVGAGQTLSIYELYFQQFASLEPNPALRDVLVRNFLLAAGLNPNQRITAGFINRALSLQHSQNLSYALQGLRSNFVLSTFRTNSRRLDTISTAQDDLSRVDALRQHGYVVSWSYRLTPASSLVVTAAEQITPGRGAVAGNGLKSLNVSWGEQISSRASLSVTARHAQADGARPYTESAVTASLGIRF